MKKIFLLIFFYTQLPAVKSQQATYWQQQVDHVITVSLNDSAKTLDGHTKIQYHNNSPDTIFFIWFHVWPNAYKNDQTAFSDQLLENGRTDFYFSNGDKRGYINRLHFKASGITTKTTDHPQHQDIIKVILPNPLPPKQSVNIETVFHVKLPENFSRSGYIKKAFQITQWYPKPAVYDKNGWHEMPYLDQGEFYSEFGNYDVTISLAKTFIVASTGLLVDEKTRAGIKTWHFQQENVHDFAWFADADFLIHRDTLQLDSKTIDVFAYYNKANAGRWKNAIHYIKSAIKTKSKWIGEYPYKTVTVVESPDKSDGGMEYPTITLIATPSNEKELDFLINHEVGHNWFYGILASNERKHPWMDEGMNTYYDNRYSLEQYADKKSATESSFISNKIPENLMQTALKSVIAVKKDQPIETSSEKLNALNYGLIAYAKAGDWMKLLEMEMGQTGFDKFMQEYYMRWKFKHPYPEDFKALAAEMSQKNTDTIFSLLHTKGSLQKPVKKDIRITSFFSLKDADKHHYISMVLSFGYNFYDKLMVGALIHNYSLPTSKLQYLVTPLYGTKSKKINGLGRISYSWYPGSKGQKAEVSVAASKFTVDDFTDSTNTKNYLSFSKIVPSIKYLFSNKDPNSTVRKFIQWKTFFINETSLLFTRDTTNQIDVITYPVKHRYLNQLQFVIENFRKLYPYKAALQAEQGDGFVRLNFTGNYFFNYANGGGLDLRFFAGKFFYTGDQTYLTQFKTDPYHLNMTGPKGYEDYTYNNYFIGRNEFEKYASQQIMIRDGGFKVRTDYLSNKIGKTDDWLSAINFTTTIPKEINPLELIPLKIIRLKIFVDIGTYAEAWKKDAGTGRFLYDAGLQISLFNIVTIYAPLLYSKVYNDYFKSTITEKRFSRNLSFSIDIQHISLKKLFPQSPF